jgi:hypothetical protein
MPQPQTSCGKPVECSAFPFLLLTATQFKGICNRYDIGGGSVSRFALERFPGRARPQEYEADHRRRSDDDHGGERQHVLGRKLEQPGDAERHEDAERSGDPQENAAHARDYPVGVVETNYWSGEDYVVEFLGYRFGFNGHDFEQRVTAAAVKLGLLEGNELDGEETADLVELAADGVIQEVRSGLGRYLVRHCERVSLVVGESLVYGLRKLVFRGAWLDHRVKEGLLDVAFDDENGDFGYRDPRGGRALLELAPVPSWHELQFRR